MIDKFLCSQCGACCKLAGKMGGKKYNLPINEDGSCGHLKNNVCSIYDNRPDICRVDKMTHANKGESKKDYFIKATKACHTLIDLLDLDQSYKIDIKEYDR